MKTRVVETFVDVIGARDACPTNGATTRRSSAPRHDAHASVSTRRTLTRVKRDVTRGSRPVGETLAGECVEAVNTRGVVETRVDGAVVCRTQRTRDVRSRSVLSFMSH